MTQQLRIDRRIEFVPLSRLKAHPRNPKDHDVGELVQSIKRFGFLDAVIVDGRTGLLVSGHGRVEALRAMFEAWRPTEGQPIPDGVKLEAGEWCVPVQAGWASKSDEEAEAFLIAANRLVERGGWDSAKLEAILVDLAKSGADALIGIGYDTEDVDKLVNEAQRAALGASDPNEVPDPKEVWVKRGDLFEVGNHRVLCGDSTLQDDVDRLVGRAEIDCVWTDPPYGVEYEGKAGSIMNDGAAGLPTLLAGAFGQMFRVLKPGSFIYVAHPAGKLSIVFANQVVEAGFEFKQGLVWVKDSLVLGRSDYHYEHEPIIYALKPGATGRRGRFGKASGWYGGNDQTSVLRFPKPKRSEDHPTMKPVELVEACLKNSTAPGFRVFEPFSGSGTTLLACERLERRCFAMELDPRFVQVALERWAMFTGRKPVKVG